jgi:hypothetical protein
MSYVSPKSGKQYVLLTVPGEAVVGVGVDHAGGDDDSNAVNAGGGYVIAYALPEAP